MTTPKLFSELMILSWIVFFSLAGCTGGSLNSGSLEDRLSDALAFDDGELVDGEEPDGQGGNDRAQISTLDNPSLVMGGQGFMILLKVDGPDAGSASIARVAIDGYTKRHYRVNITPIGWLEGQGYAVLTGSVLPEDKLYNQTFRLNVAVEDSGGLVSDYNSFLLNIGDGRCQDSTELCDLLDNNCNGTVNEGFDDLFDLCDEGSGACLVHGRLMCSADGSAAECDADTSDSDGQACNDGLFCTEGETCSAGQCGGGIELDCSSADDTCNLGACNEDNDICGQTPRTDDPPCDDGLWCTINDNCNAGTCEGQPRDCTGSGDACHADGCIEQTQACGLGPNLPDDTPCGGANVCLAGVCGLHDCAALDQTQCNAGLDGIETCEAGPDGFRVWSTAVGCDAQTPVCDTQTATCFICGMDQDCVGQSQGDVCEGGECVCGAGGSACSDPLPACQPMDHVCAECATAEDCSGFEVCTVDWTCGDLFERHHSYFQSTSTSGPFRVVLSGDFTGDGMPDALVSHSANDGGMWLFVNQGGDLFASSATIQPVVPDPRWIAQVADFNDDNVADVVQAGNEGVGVFLNNGSGQLADPVGAGLYFTTDLAQAAVAAADFDGDTVTDFVVLDSPTGGACLRVFINDGDGTSFTEGACQGSLSPALGGMTALDIDGDLDQDLAFLSGGDTRMLINDGTGAFTYDPADDITGNSEAQIMSAELNGDGADDLVIVAGQYTNQVTVCLNSTAKTFLCSVYDTSPWTQPLAATPFDFDGDGDLDLAVATNRILSLRIMINDGFGSYTMSDKTYSLPDGVRSVAAANFDGNSSGLDSLIVAAETQLGRKDQVVYLRNIGAELQGPESIYIATSTYVNSADLDNDGDMELLAIRRGSTPMLFAWDVDADNKLVKTISAGVSYPYNVTTGLVNPDEYTDLVLTGDSSVEICSNASGIGIGGCNTLTPSSGANMRFALAEDLTGDGRAEILACSKTSLHYWVNDGTGSFAPEVTTTASTFPDYGTPSISVGDLDGDGDNDVVWGAGQRVYIITNNAGVLDFDTRQEIRPTGGQYPYQVLVHDDNRDGFPDIMLSLAPHPDQENAIMILRNDGSGGFSEGSAVNIGLQTYGCRDPRGMIRVDIDMDSDLDVVATCSENDRMIILLQGEFDLVPLPYTIYVGHGPFSLAHGDFDNDGDQDIVTGNYHGDNLGVIWNQYVR